MDSEPYVRREEMNQFEKRMDSYNLSLKEDISALTGNVKELVNTVQQLVVNTATTNEIWKGTVNTFEENISDLDARTKYLEETYRGEVHDLKKELEGSNKKILDLEHEVSSLVSDKETKLDWKKWGIRSGFLAALSLTCTVLGFYIKEKFFQ